MFSKKATAIIQARVGSSRLPGKIMLNILGKPVIQHVYERVKCCKTVDKIIVSIPDTSENNIIEDFFAEFNIPVFRGNENDPLKRYYDTANHFKVRDIIRVMSDCPLLDPDIIDEVVNKYFNDHLDVCHLSGDFPTGLDTTIFNFNVLEQTHKKTTLNSDRQHITPYMTKNKDFKVGKIFMYNKFGGYRFVMDRHEDFELIKIIYEKLYAKNNIFKTKAILELMGAEKNLRKINSHLPRDEDYNKSRLEEKAQD